MKTIEDRAHEYAEALNDIADMLDMPTGSTSIQIVKAAGKEWANGIHTCHDQCPRAMCVLRRERDEWIAEAKRWRDMYLEYDEMLEGDLEKAKARISNVIHKIKSLEKEIND